MSLPNVLNPNFFFFWVSMLIDTALDITDTADAEDEDSEDDEDDDDDDEKVDDDGVSAFLTFLSFFCSVNPRGRLKPAFILIFF